MLFLVQARRVSCVHTFLVHCKVTGFILVSFVLNNQLFAMVPAGRALIKRSASSENLAKALVCGVGRELRTFATPEIRLINPTDWNIFAGLDPFNSALCLPGVSPEVSFEMPDPMFIGVPPISQTEISREEQVIQKPTIVSHTLDTQGWLDLAGSSEESPRKQEVFKKKLLESSIVKAFEKRQKEEKRGKEKQQAASISAGVGTIGGVDSSKLFGTIQPLQSPAFFGSFSKKPSEREGITFEQKRVQGQVPSLLRGEKISPSITISSLLSSSSFKGESGTTASESSEEEQESLSLVPLHTSLPGLFSPKDSWIDLPIGKDFLPAQLFVQPRVIKPTITGPMLIEPKSVARSSVPASKSSSKKAPQIPLPPFPAKQLPRTAQPPVEFATEQPAPGFAEFPALPTASRIFSQPSEGLFSAENLVTPVSSQSLAIVPFGGAPSVATAPLQLPVLVQTPSLEIVPFRERSLPSMDSRRIPFAAGQFFYPTSGFTSSPSTQGDPSILGLSNRHRAIIPVVKPPITVPMVAGVPTAQEILAGAGDRSLIEGYASLPLQYSKPLSDKELTFLGDMLKNLAEVAPIVPGTQRVIVPDVNIKKALDLSKRHNLALVWLKKKSLPGNLTFDGPWSVIFNAEGEQLALIGHTSRRGFVPVLLDRNVLLQFGDSIRDFTTIQFGEMATSAQPTLDFSAEPTAQGLLGYEVDFPNFIFQGQPKSSVVQEQQLLINEPVDVQPSAQAPIAEILGRRESYAQQEGVSVAPETSALQKDAPIQQVPKTTSETSLRRATQEPIEEVVLPARQEEVVMPVGTAQELLSVLPTAPVAGESSQQPIVSAVMAREPLPKRLPKMQRVVYEPTTAEEIFSAVPDEVVNIPRIIPGKKAEARVIDRSLVTQAAQEIFGAAPRLPLPGEQSQQPVIPAAGVQKPLPKTPEPKIPMKEEQAAPFVVPGQEEQSLLVEPSQPSKSYFESGIEAIQAWAERNVPEVAKKWLKKNHEAVERIKKDGPKVDKKKESPLKKEFEKISKSKREKEAPTQKELDCELKYRKILSEAIRNEKETQDFIVRKWTACGGPLQSELSIARSEEKALVLFGSYNKILSRLKKGHSESRASLDRVKSTIFTVLAEGQEQGQLYDFARGLAKIRDDLATSINEFMRRLGDTISSEIQKMIDRWRTLVTR